MCQGVPSCEFDYLLTGRREFGLDTLAFEKRSEYIKMKGEQKCMAFSNLKVIINIFLVVSCGPLMKNPGVLKHPPGNNYLHGVTVTFTCKPQFFLHGDQQRTCVREWGVYAVSFEWLEGVQQRETGKIKILELNFPSCETLQMNLGERFVVAGMVGVVQR